MGSAATQFKAEDGHTMAPIAQAARKRKSQKTAYNQAIELQTLIMRDATLDEIKPITRAAIARAWCELEEAKRKLKMKPLPGSLRPSESKPKRKAKDPVSFTPAPDCGVLTPSNSVPASEPFPNTTSNDKPQ